MKDQPQSPLAKLVSLCKCEVSISVNEHRGNYETIQQFFEIRNGLDSYDISAELLADLVKADCVVQVYCYPRTPVGSYKIIDSDIDRAITRAIAAVLGEDDDA